MLHLQRFLCKSERVWQWVDKLRELCDAVHNDIVDGGDLVGTDPHWVVGHETTLEAA